MVCGLRNIPEKIILASSLESLLEEGVISEIHGRLKSGKEAEVFAVSYGENVVAAKVYKDRAQRNFKNNATYLEGRSVRNSRSQRAMDRGTRFGQEAAEDAWKVAEANALYKLHAAGVRVPTPVMFLEGVLLMELVRGSNGEPAPRLIDSEIDREAARAAYMDMLAQLVKMLCCDLIHGDLSPYNVLWAEAGATIIDFPQTIAAAGHGRAEFFFQRDARNILGHFAAIEPSLRGRLNGDVREIWRAYVRRELSPEFMPSGQPQRFDERGPAPQRSGEGARFERPQPQHQPRPHAQGRPQRPDSRERDAEPRAQQPRGPRLHMASAAENIASQRGGPESRGPRPEQRGAPDSRGPRPEQRGNAESRGPRPQQRGGQESRGPRPQQRNGHDARGPRPEQRGGQESRGPRPEQRGNAESRGPRPEQRSQPRPQRAQQQRQAQRRAPEVIVIKRRAPEPAAPAESSSRAPDSVRSKRR